MSKNDGLNADLFVKKELAIILVDMQEGYVENLRDGEKERIIPNQRAVLEYCRVHDIPVIVLEFNTSRRGETIPELLEVAKKNSNFDLLRKNYDDGFLCTDLDSTLKSLGVKTIFFMGVNACYCVYSTARSTLARGYEIVTSNSVLSGMKHHNSDNDIPWYNSNGTCIDSVDAFIKSIV